jgi:hypothetical protein
LRRSIVWSARIDYGLIAMRSGRPFRLTCTGDFNASTFTSIQVDGQLYPPQRDETRNF